MHTTYIIIIFLIANLQVTDIQSTYQIRAVRDSDAGEFVFFRDHPCFCEYCLVGDYDRCLNKTIIGGWKRKRVKQKAVARMEPTDFQKVQGFFSKIYSCNHNAYGIIIAVMEKTQPIDGDDAGAEADTSLRFFVLKTLLEKQTKTISIDNSKPGIQFEIQINTFAAQGVPLCRDGNTWNFRKAGGDHAVWIPWNEIIVTRDMVDTNSTDNPYNYLGQRPYQRGYDSSFSSRLEYSIDRTCVEKLIEYISS